jgi:hypothetical protein
VAPTSAMICCAESTPRPTRDDFHKVSRAVGPQQTSVQHTEETNFRTEVSRIASNFEKRFGAGAEQQAIDELFVL